MGTAVVEPGIESRVHYLNASYGIKSWLLTTDHKRIAVLYLASITFFFFIGGAAAVSDALESDITSRRVARAGNLQQAFQHARDHHGLLLSDPLHSRGAGKFPCPPDDWGARPGLPSTQSSKLVCFHGGRVVHSLCGDRRGSGHRLDFLHTVEHHVRQYAGDFCGLGSVHRRLLLDFDRAELRGHHSQDARPRPDLVQIAALHLVHLCHQHHSDSGHSGARRSASRSWPWKGSSTWESSILRWAATPSSSSTYSGSTPIPRFTS